MNIIFCLFVLNTTNKIQQWEVTIHGTISKINPNFYLLISIEKLIWVLNNENKEILCLLGKFMIHDIYMYCIFLNFFLYICRFVLGDEINKWTVGTMMPGYPCIMSFIIYLVVIMQNLHSIILMTSQLPISARHAKNAYQWCHNEKVHHNKQIYSQILQKFVFLYYGDFSLIAYDR
jgi:hypothetical protein